MKIGLLSDTHSYIDDPIINSLKNSHEIWHGGDIGDGKVITELEKIAPLRAVYGNIDDNTLRNSYPENNYFQIEGLNILITHIAGSPPKYNGRVKAFLKENKVDVLICGHSHILKVARDPENKLIFINPGAAGVHGFHKMRTMMTFEIDNMKISNMNVIELGKRGRIL